MRLPALRFASIGSWRPCSRRHAFSQPSPPRAAPPFPSCRLRAGSPNEPVEFVVQSAAGGGSDIFARTMAKILADEKIVTVPINVVNKPGGSGAVAYSYLNQKKGDPHVIATATGSYITTPDPGPFAGQLQGLHQPRGAVRRRLCRRGAHRIALQVAQGADRGGEAEAELASASAAAASAASDDIIETPAGEGGRRQAQLHRVPERRRGQRGAARRQRRLRQPESQRGRAAHQGEAAAADRDVLAAAARQMEGCADRKEQGIDVTLDQFRGVMAAGGLTKDQALFWQNAMVKLFQSPGFKKYLDDNGLRPLLHVGDDAEKYLAEQTTFYTEVLTELGHGQEEVAVAACDSRCAAGGDGHDSRRFLRRAAAVGVLRCRAVGRLAPSSTAPSSRPDRGSPRSG